MVTNRFAACLGLVIVATGALVAQEPSKPKTVDLDVAIKVLRDPASGQADLDRLAGKTYEGRVVVRAVRFQPDGSALVQAEPAGDPPAGAVFVALRFVGGQDDPRLVDLRPNGIVSVRAALTKVSLARGRVAEFEGLEINPGG